MDELLDKLAVAGRNLEESLRIAIVFHSVPSSYLNLVQGLQSQINTDWTVLIVKKRLLEVYWQRQNHGESLAQDVKAMKLGAASGKTSVCFIYFFFFSNRITSGSTVKSAVIRDCWVIDSGGTCHMTCDRSFFADLRKTDGAMTLADGKKTKASGIG